MCGRDPSLLLAGVVKERRAHLIEYQLVSLAKDELASSVEMRKMNADIGKALSSFSFRERSGASSCEPLPMK